MKVAVGITTYNRPQFADKSIRAARAALAGLDCPLAVYNDGSGAKHRGAYKRAYRRAESATIFDASENRGVAYAKNRLIDWMLKDTNAEWLFLLEDDILIESPEAVTEYIRIAEQTGIHHLSFAHHGTANSDGPVDVDDEVAYYSNSIGAWCSYSREVLTECGSLDENFINAWEHVEHEMRMIYSGWMPGAGPHRFPDARDSALWLREIPGALEQSVIRPRDDWNSSIVNGLSYWKNEKPETFEILFGTGMPLEQYALTVLGSEH